MKYFVVVLISASFLLISGEHGSTEFNNKNLRETPQYNEHKTPLSDEDHKERLKHHHAMANKLKKRGYRQNSLPGVVSDIVDGISDFIYDVKQLKQQNPGLGTDFMYIHGINGTLQKISLKYDNDTAEKLKQFYDAEKEIETECDKLNKKQPETKSSRSNARAIKQRSKYNGEKFNFSSADYTFKFYDRNYTEGINMEYFPFEQYNATKETKLVTHGFMSSGSADTCIRIKNNYLNDSDVNVIILDWSDSADNIIYPLPAIATGKVADYCASFLGFLFNNVGVKEEDVHLIGHSLGAHVVGFCGKRLLRAGFKNLTRCTGLDPALPLFTSVHIDRQNCKFVDIIHTDAGWFGNSETLGHVDFYPNGGDAPQPNCTSWNILSVDSCSHGMSWKYFAESILDDYAYIASCNSTYRKNFTIPMGDATPDNARGICKLNTN